MISIAQITYVFGQHYNAAYGSPRVVLTETDPWLMVIGSDVPTFALYENGQIIYKIHINNKTKYFEVKIPKEKIAAILLSLGVTDSLFNVPSETMASRGTDQPTNELILNIDSLQQKSVYGNLRSEAARLKTPRAFLNTYDHLITYRDTLAKEWLPDSVEVMITAYNHSPEQPLNWPAEWPDLKSSSTVKRSDDLYSIYLDKKYFEGLLRLLSSLKEKQALLINGAKFSASCRFPFPNIR